MKCYSNKTQFSKLISHRRNLTANTHFWRFTALEPSANIRQASNEGHQRKSILTWSVIKIYLNLFFCSIRSFGYCYFLDFKDLEAVPSVRREIFSSTFPILLVHLILIRKLISLVFGWKTDTKLWKTESHCWNVYQIGALGNVCLQTEAKANSGIVASNADETFYTMNSIIKIDVFTDPIKF